MEEQDNIRERIDERQRHAGAGVPINITDLVVKTIGARPGFTIQLVNQSEAHAEKAIDANLQRTISNPFSLNEQQQARFNEWNLKQNENFRVSGGHITFEFTPTRMGTVVVARNTLTNYALDLTDYSKN